MKIEATVLANIKKALPHGAISKIARESTTHRQNVLNELSRIKDDYDEDIIFRAICLLKDAGYPVKSFKLNFSNHTL